MRRMRRFLMVAVLVVGGMLAGPKATADTFPLIKVDHCQVMPYIGGYLCSTGIPGGKPWICLGYVQGIANGPNLGVDCV